MKDFLQGSIFTISTGGLITSTLCPYKSPQRKSHGWVLTHCRLEADLPRFCSRFGGGVDVCAPLCVHKCA